MTREEAKQALLKPQEEVIEMYLDSIQEQVDWPYDYLESNSVEDDYGLWLDFKLAGARTPALHHETP